jgi:hypothetical protein
MLAAITLGTVKAIKAAVIASWVLRGRRVFKAWRGIVLARSRSTESTQVEAEEKK